MSRDNELRRQAEETCARRTRELEDARTALARQSEDAELGRGLRKLAKQVTRLRRTPGVPFGFTPRGVAKSVAEELEEVIAAEPCSTDAHGEIGDLLSTVLSLAEAHNAPVLTTISNAAGKLERRLDLVGLGATWHDAKVAESNEQDIEAARERSPGARAPKRVEDCEIIEDYMPPFPGPDTRPIMAVRHEPSGMFLRHSKGPRQGHFWDIYGDDYQTRKLAIRAIEFACADGWVPGRDDE